MPRAVARGDQFLWGRDILVVAGRREGRDDRGASICRAGAWFDFWTEERVDGGREIDRAVDLATMPLHVRAGAIIPLGPVRQYVEQPIDAPLTIVVYPGADGAFTLYEDDGRSFEYRQGRVDAARDGVGRCRATAVDAPGAGIADAAADAAADSRADRRDEGREGVAFAGRPSRFAECQEARGSAAWKAFVRYNPDH